MIPAVNGFLQEGFEIEEQASRTYRMDHDIYNIRGYTDNKKAVEQAIFKMLFTERYQYIIYSWNYGAELEDLFGQPISYVIPEIERRIREALLQDTRIEEVDNFTFEVGRNKVHTTFTAHSIFGDIQVTKAVDV